MFKRIITFLLVISVIGTLLVPVEISAASEFSGWVRPSEVPAGCAITNRKYGYNKTYYTTSGSSSMDGWEQYDTKTSYGAYGSWSGWSDTKRTKSDTREVETRPIYHYHRYAKSETASSGSYQQSTSYPNEYEEWFTVKLTISSDTGDGKGYKWYYGNSNPNTVSGSYRTMWKDSPFETTQYRYRDRSKTITYYYRRTVYEESSAYPSGSDITNIQEWVQYRYNYYLDLNGLINGNYSKNIAGYGTADVYINGVLVANDVSDYYVAHPYGTTYTIADIKASNGHQYDGVAVGSLSGTITGATEVRLSFSVLYYGIDVNSVIDGSFYDGLYDGVNDPPKDALPPEPYFTFDLVIDGVVRAANVSDFYAAHGEFPYGVHYAVNLYTKPGYTYLGHDTNFAPPSGDLHSQKEVRLLFKSNTYNVAYHANGGSGTMQNTSFCYWKEQALSPNAFTRNGYRFLGWSQNNNNAKADYADGQTVSRLATEDGATVTLYAIWEKIPEVSVGFSEESFLGGKRITLSSYINKTAQAVQNAPLAIYRGENKTYVAYDNADMSWQEAKDFCENQGGHLVTITSPEEQAIIEKLIEHAESLEFYAGASDADVEGTWAWITGETWEYEKWNSPHEPNDANGGEDYLTVWGQPNVYGDNAKGHWNDAVFDLGDGFGAGFICEFEDGKLPSVIGSIGEAVTIYYTTDGSEPTTQSAVYAGPIEFTEAEDVVVKAIAVKDGCITVGTHTYFTKVGEAPEAIIDIENTMEGKTVTISCNTEETSLFYTLDGSVPTTQSEKYAIPLTFNTEGIIHVKAIAAQKGHALQKTETTGLSSVECVAKPETTIHTWVGGGEITVSSETEGAQIYYTTDGTDPTSETANRYYEAVEVTQDTIFSAVAKKSGYAMSEKTSVFVNVTDRELYAPYAIIDNVIGGKKVSLLCETADATIYYTVDGSVPKETSMPYSEPIFLNESTHIRAIAVYDGNTSEEYNYKVEVSQLSPPEISTVVGDGQTIIRLTGTTTGSMIYYTLDGSSPTENSTLYTGVPICVTQTTQVRAIAVRAGYINSIVVSEEAIVLFDTPPTIDTKDAAEITEYSAVLCGDVTDDGGLDIISKGFYYCEKGQMSAAYYVAADKDFKATIPNLKPNTEYWYYAQAGNEKGFANGALKVFKTLEVIPDYPEKIQITPSFVSINKGEKRTLLVSVLPENAKNREVKWYSSQPSIAKVTQKGVVTGRKKGEAVITAVSYDGKVKDKITVCVVDGAINGEFDFSEIQMAKAVHPLKNPNHMGDTFTVDSIGTGGNAIMATAYLARWSGAVLESKDPYPESSDAIDTTQYTSDYHVQEILYLPLRKDALDNDDIKKAIMEYGAVYSQFKVDYNYFKNGYTNYYLPPETQGFVSGHAIAIVGWDDDYPKKNFRVEPKNNGAFICKNSWGTEDAMGKVGEDGYFYISYYDAFLGRYGVNAVFCNLETNTNYNTNYQYDPLGPVLNKEVGESVYMANVFPRYGECLQQDESLEAVAFYTTDKNVAYEVYVIPDFSEAAFFETLGEPVALGVMPYAGYHTVTLKTPIALKEGTRFSVVVKLMATDGKLSIFLEAPLEDMASGNATANEWESFLSEDGETWIDTHLELLPDSISNTNVCVKAFTRREDAVSLMCAIEEEEKEIQPISIDTFLANGFTINPDYIEETKNKKDADIQLFTEDAFGTGADAPSIVVGNNNTDNVVGARFQSKFDLRYEGNSLSKVKNQGSFNTCWAFAAYASLESCMMKKAQTLRYNDNFAGSTPDGIVSGSIIDYPVTGVQMETKTVHMGVNTSRQLLATVTPSNATDKSLIWESSAPEIVRVDTSGSLTALQIGEAVVTVTNPNSGFSASCTVTVTEIMPVEKIILPETNLSCERGEQLVLQYSVVPETADVNSVVIAVEDESVATVKDGIISALSEGSTIITITTADGGLCMLATLTVLPDTTGEADKVDVDYAVQSEGNISTRISNEHIYDVKAKVIVAAYDKETNACIYVKSNETIIPAESMLYHETAIEESDAYTFKVFVWKQNEIQPLSLAVKSEE